MSSRRQSTYHMRPQDCDNNNAGGRNQYHRSRSSVRVPNACSHHSRSWNNSHRNSSDRKRPHSPERYDRSRRQRSSSGGQPKDARSYGSHSLASTSGNEVDKGAEMHRARPPSRSNPSYRDENTKQFDNLSSSEGRTNNANTHHSSYYHPSQSRTSHERRRLPLASRQDFSPNRTQRNSTHLFNNNHTIPELIQIAHVNLATLKPSATAAFWNKVLKQMSGRNASNSRLPNHRDELGRHLNQIFEHTQNTLTSFAPIDLSQTIYSMAKIADVLRKRGGRRYGEDGSDVLSRRLLNSDMSPKKDLFRSFAIASRDKLYHFGARELSNIAFAYALIDYVPEFDDGSDLFRNIATQSARRRTEFNAQDISNMMWAYATIDKPLDLFDAVGNPQRFQSPSKDKVEITFLPERNVIPADELNSNGHLSKMWWFFSRLCTVFVPDVLLCWIGSNVDSIAAKAEAKQAWREKISIFVVMILCSAAFIGVSGVAPMLLCGETEEFVMDGTQAGNIAEDLLNDQNDIICQALNIVMYSIMILIAAVLVIQCICSLIYLFRSKHAITRAHTRSKLIVMVPCYNEGDKELRKTIDSVMDTTYPDDNKVLLVIADGNVTGKGEKMSTPNTLAKLLGFKQSHMDRAYECNSIGKLPANRAKIYYGTYVDFGRVLKYIVIAKAENRGKRDSQLLITGLLNRFHHGRSLNSLDIAIKYALDNLQLPLDEIRYLMAIDADTRIDRESISHMTYSMNKNDRILALCGETKVDNKSQSWVTSIQVFEYYTNHHMKKAFESVFGCVTCLPGCFTMYRLFSNDGRPLLSCDDVYQRYSYSNVQIKTLHDKNLYHLGEDRMLTTLLLRYFPDMKLSFVPEATCYTVVPHTFSVLLSQRRRWINSTFHNMLELIQVSNPMCGVCCLSMKSIVVLDLVATLILPASFIYVCCILFITLWTGEPISLFMLVVWGIVVGVQVVVFLLRSRWDYWWWFIIFVVAGVPVFYFVLPLYSFWHMDDFSWGTTRQVSDGNEKGDNLKSTSTEETDM